MRRDKVAIGIVGCGGHAMENLIPVLQAQADVDCIWTADPALDAARAAAARFLGCTPFQSWQEGWRAGRPDAVVVAATPQVHLTVARTALEGGVAVFVEKPLAVSREEAVLLAQCAATTGLATMVGHNLRHTEAAREFHRIVADEAFGQALAMEMRYFASKPRGDRWGLRNPVRSFLLSHATHALDFMIQLMGPVGRVEAARAATCRDTITVSAQLGFGEGRMGNLLTTTAAPHFDFRASVIGSNDQIARIEGTREVSLVGAASDRKRWSRLWVDRTLNTGYASAGYEAELALFLTAVRSRRPESARPSFADEVAVYDALEMIEARLLA
jgi:predicted dehydrogenase